MARGKGKASAIAAAARAAQSDESPAPRDEAEAMARIEALAKHLGGRVVWPDTPELAAEPPAPPTPPQPSAAAIARIAALVASRGGKAPDVHDPDEILERGAGPIEASDPVTRRLIERGVEVSLAAPEAKPALLPQARPAGGLAHRRDPLSGTCSRCGMWVNERGDGVCEPG